MDSTSIVRGSKREGGVTVVGLTGFIVGMGDGPWEGRLVGVTVGFLLGDVVGVVVFLMVGTEVGT